MRIQKDKIQHIVVTFVMTAMVCFTFHTCGVTMTASTSAGFVAGMTLGCGKEYGDKMAIGNHWDWQDLLADFIGAVTGALLHFSIHLIF